MKFPFHRGLYTAAMLLLLPLASSTNPVVDRAELPLPVQQEPQPDPQVVAQFGLLESPTLQRFITSKGQQMASVSNRPRDVKGFVIVDSPVINAFAAPDGFVYFTRGIMAHFNNEAQFAGVLGHEIGHITAQHIKKQQTRSTIASVLLGVGSIASRRIGQLAEPLSQGASVLFLKFGRDAERESDRLGVEYSSKIGYDASQMADFFLTLQRQEQQAGGGSVPGFLSTHPNSADRYKTVTQLAAQQKQQLGNARLSVNRDQYLRLLEGLPYGEDPRQGFVEGNVFYHPDLKFRFPVPSGWKHQNSPQQFQIAEPSGKALMILLTAPGKSLDEAAQALAQQLKLQSPQAQKTTINSFPAVAIQGNQVGQDQQTGQQAVSASTLSYIIQDGNTMYAFVGLSAPQSFSTYSAEFNRIAQGFQRLTDASKLNRQPERVRVKTAKTSTTLAQALAASGVPSSRRDEMAILNGMQLNDRLSAGMMYKVVGK